MSQPASQDSSPHPQGRVVLVTGATSGIGFHTARQLAARGAYVLITGRDQKRGEEAARAVASAAGHARVEFIQADHATVGANNQLGQAVTERLGQLGLATRLDVLVNNVGGIFATRTSAATRPRPPGSASRLAWTASPAAISGQYMTEHGKPGRYPPGVADPAVQDQVVRTAAHLARHASTAADRTGRP